MRMRGFVASLFVCGLTLCPRMVAAQTIPIVGPTAVIGFDQVGADLATVQGWSYAVHINGGAGVPIAVTCTGTTTFTCTFVMPAAVPDGRNTLSVDATNLAGTSPPSNVLTLTLVKLAPLAPANLRIVKAS